MRTVPKPRHCGECDPRTRQIEDSEGRPSRCPRCHPLTAPPPQAPVSGPEADDQLWMARARQIIRQLASEGQPFAAEDVAARGIGNPPNPNWWGMAFQAARRAGDITEVAIGTSPVASRRGGTRRLWIGDTARRAYA